MSDIINLSCPSCGGKLQFTNDIERFACGYCGNELLVRRSGGIVSLTPVVNAIKDVQIGVDKTASELAIARLTNEINNISRDINTIEKQIITKKAYYIFILILGIMILLFGIVSLKGPASKSFGFSIILISLIPFYSVYRFNGELGRANKLVENLQDKYQNIKKELEIHKQIVSQR